MPFSGRALWLTMAVVLPSRLLCGEEAASVDRQHRAFFERHCCACHSAELAEGNFRADELSFALDSVAAVEQWQGIADAIGSGDMPPDGEQEPDPAAKEELLDTVLTAIAQARRQFADEGSAVILRRLNRREYRGSLESLLGVEVDVSNLPDDRGTARFDTFSSGLFLSAAQIEQYLETGRIAAQAALQRLHAGAEPRSRRIQPEDFARKHMSSLLRGQLAEHAKYAAWKASGKPPQDYGWPNEREAERVEVPYRTLGPFLTHYLMLPAIDTGAYLSVPIKSFFSQVAITIPPREPCGPYVLRTRLGVAPGSGPPPRFLELIQLWRPQQSTLTEERVIGVYEVTGTVDEPVVLEMPVMIDPRFSREFAVREKRHMNRGAEFFRFHAERGRNGIGAEPALWIDWIEWEGPFEQANQQQDCQRLFGVTTLAAVEHSAARDLLGHFATAACRGISPAADFLDQLVAAHKAEMNAGKSFNDALVEPMAIVLSSSGFLYLHDPGSSDARLASAAGRIPLTPQELATRLAYFLTARPPAEWLLSEAQSGGLGEPARLQATANRLLDQPEVLAFCEGFCSQWLDLDRLDFFQFDWQLHPGFDESTREAAKQEVYHTFRTLVVENLDARLLLEADFVVVNSLLAQYYGLAMPDGAPVVGMQFRKVPLSANSPRGGLLGMAAVLGMGSNGEQTSPVERGAWVLKKLLASPPPKAPANVPQLSRLGNQPVSTRERLRMHQEQPQCAHCHRKIDPVGMGLENFDAGGLWRTVEHTYRNSRIFLDGPQGKVVTGTFPIEPSGAFHRGPAFADFYELRREIARHGDDFVRGLVEHLFEYALGRPVSLGDQGTIDGIVTDAQKEGYGLAGIVRSIVTTPQFQSR